MNDVIKIDGVPINEEKLVSSNVVAEFLGLTRQRLQILTWQGVVPGYKIGGAWRFRMSEIAAWLESQKNTSTDYNAEQAKK